MASLGYAEMAPHEVCRQLSELGYGGVEWTLAHFNPRTKSRKELADLVRVTREHGLEISDVAVQQDVVCPDERVRQDRIDLILECIDAAAETGVRNLNVFTGPCTWVDTAPKIGRDIKEGEAWRLVYDAFDRLVKAASERRVCLAVEGVFGMLCHDYYTTRVLIDHYDSAYLGVNFDPSHDVLYEHFDTGWIAAQWGRRIKNVHLKDAAGIPVMGKYLFPQLGEGRVDWKGFLAALDEIGYDGFLSVEFESFTWYETVLRRDPREAARLSLETFAKLAGG